MWDIKRIFYKNTSKFFAIAGPVLVYGTVASVVYGIIYWVTTLL